MAAEMNTAELAEELRVSPHTLRRFLRDCKIVESPGKGGRYRIPRRQLRSLKRRYATWRW